MNKSLRVLVRGHVQGVAFRIHTQREAANLGITGWIKNRGDGSVEVYAEGTIEKLENLLLFLHIGPPGADVEEVQSAWGDFSGKYLDFSIRFF